MPELHNKGPAPNRRCAIEFVSHWFYNIISFGERGLPAPVSELGVETNSFRFSDVT